MNDGASEFAQAERDVVLESNGATCNESTEMGQRGLLSGIKILIAEDNYLVAEDLAQTIRSADGQAGARAQTVKAALDALDGSAFDGVLVDAQLMDGPAGELARRLERERVPYIVLSGYERSGLQPELRTAPYISKPFNRQQLIELAARYFARELRSPPKSNGR